jgi:hypothetical protein
MGRRGVSSCLATELGDAMGRLLDGLRRKSAEITDWTRVQFFKLWTAAAVIILFGLAFWYAPELLTWWQRNILRMIENGSYLLSYPWNNRVEYILINFGASIWLQFVLAIFLLRILMSPVARWLKRSRG